VKRFSIITPSFRNSTWLKVCIASVADQGVDLEHIIQDAGSDDGTLDWLPGDRRVRAFVEKDSGMYDAVNRGLRRASGEIVAYLNCDEQYLPGTLQSVSEWFDRHPQVEVLFGHVLVVDERGEFLCYRKVQIPNRYHLMVSHLNTFTCSTFFRRSVFEKRSLYFDPQWRALGDAEWMLRLLKSKVTMGLLHQFCSTFTDTGANLSLGPEAQREQRHMLDSAPLLARKFGFALVWQHRLKRMAGGVYSQQPFDYSIYTPQSLDRRILHSVARPTFVWKSRLTSVWQ
jgi:glycosyltransferase involved in cell wall biosynthesis